MLDENHACIMWIVLLQMRDFAKGKMAVWGPDDESSVSGEEKKMDETTVWLLEFIDMLNNLQSHQGTQILHDRCPDPLYTKKARKHQVPPDLEASEVAPPTGVTLKGRKSLQESNRI